MAEVTDLLQPAPVGDEQASRDLFGLLYSDLKRMARGRLYRVGGVPGLDTTSLVHESYLRLTDDGRLLVSDRPAFFGYVGRVMRSVVIDHVRTLQSQKRGGDQVLVTLTTDADGAAETADDRLAPQYHDLVELRYFAGLSVKEVAELRNVSMRTVEREWEKARAFLLQLMQDS
jgi:RNA polymerase sigma factor (TIGR02999 family)